MQGALRNVLEQDREPPRHARHLDPVQRRVLGVVEDQGAVREQRRISFPEVEPTPVEFHQEQEQLGGRLALTAGEPLHLRNEALVREIGRWIRWCLHTTCVAWQFLQSQEAAGAAIDAPRPRRV